MSLVTTIVEPDIARFLDKACETGNTTAHFISFKKLYRTYRQWADTEKLSVVATVTSFGNFIGKKFKRVRHDDDTYLVGVKTKERSG